MDEMTRYTRQCKPSAQPPTASKGAVRPAKQGAGPSGPRLRKRTLKELQPLVRDGLYRIGPHAHKHATCEGFTEQDMVATVFYGRELMRYVQDERLLVLGFISPSPEVHIPLHVVLDYSTPRWVDVVTAFIPLDPNRVVSRSRLAEALRYDRHVPASRWIGPG
ncbi:MAG: DUF4258 domain-containing protein [Trueperaceae bacterium]